MTTHHEHSAPPRAAYTTDEAAQALGVSRATVARLLRAGHLRGRRVGTRWLVSARSLDELVDGDDASPISIEHA